MHHKFVVRDGGDVWTGSTNWTDDSWARQENVIVKVNQAPELAAAFAITFEQLWDTGLVEGSGAQPRPTTVGGSGAPWFCPAFGTPCCTVLSKALAARGDDPDRDRPCSPPVRSSARWSR